MNNIFKIDLKDIRNKCSYNKFSIYYISVQKMLINTPKIHKIIDNILDKKLKFFGDNTMNFGWYALHNKNLSRKKLFKIMQDEKLDIFYRAAAAKFLNERNEKENKPLKDYYKMYIKNE